MAKNNHADCRNFTPIDVAKGICHANNDSIIMEEPPFFIPEFELTMAWSPLLQHHPAHRWLRQLIMHVARQIVDDEENPPQDIPIINHLF